MNTNKFDKLIGIAMLLFAIGFNLWIYRLEPTALSDPNDNTFQYALVERTNQIWSFANKKCSEQFGAWNLFFGAFCKVSYLADHWVPNWAQGYNLPSYYSHIPQITMVASYRALSEFSIYISQFSMKISNFKFQISLFQYYHWVIYLLLSFFPLSVFLSLRLIGLSWLASGFGALIASHLSTDGLYGLDPASFLWRGWGLSSQLFAMFWFPLAIAFAYRLFHQPIQSDTTSGTKFSKNASELRFRENFRYAGRYVWPILTLAATTAGHLGLGIIAFLSTAVISLSHLSNLGNLSNLKEIFKKLFLLYGGVFLLLGYWILPILIDGNYHNISTWDGIWKFDSFGYREVLKNLFNGDLFDFGRLPILTGLVFIGAFLALFTIYHLPFAVLFVFWLLLYFGRTTWGGLFNLIPGMSEFHLSRFIVGVHIAGLFLIPIGFDWIMKQMWQGGAKFSKDASELRFQENFVYAASQLMLGVVLFLFISPQTLRYAAHNDFLIQRANENYAKDASDVAALLSAIRSQLNAAPGRVFAGRGGSWGRSFRIAETPMYMYLSTYGIPTILWLPETWSPNSDTEQYFSENNPAHYMLYNVRYVVTPARNASASVAGGPIDLANGEPVEPQPFWKLLETGKTWKLYDVTFQTGNNTTIQQFNNSSMGYITTGIRPAIVSTGKEDYRSLIRLWMHSDYPKQGLFPELTFDKNYPKNTGLPNFRMLDEVTYKVPVGTTHNLFSDVPRYQLPMTNDQLPTIISQSSDSDMLFSASVDVPPGCTECLVILKQSFHPSWRATLDGKRVQTMTVFPFYIGVSVPEGTHEVVFSYQPSGLKTMLLFLSLISLGTLIWRALPSALHKIKAKP